MRISISGNPDTQTIIVVVTENGIVKYAEEHQPSETLRDGGRSICTRRQRAVIRRIELRWMKHAPGESNSRSNADWAGIEAAPVRTGF